MQSDSISPGTNVIVIDDVMATGEQHCATPVSCSRHTGGSAKAAGELIRKLGGNTLEYMFVIGVTFLKGGEKLDAPSYSMIEWDD
jgi:adenine phosphoribosyltransferase